MSCSLASHAYDLDYDYDGSKLRNTASQSVMSLLIIKSIKASELVKRASTLAQGRFIDHRFSQKVNPLVFVSSYSQ